MIRVSRFYKKTSIMVIILVLLTIFIIFSLSACNLEENFVGTYAGSGFGNDGTFTRATLTLKKDRSFEFAASLPYIGNGQPMYAYGTYEVHGNSIILTLGASHDRVTYIYNTSDKSLKTDRNNIVLYKQ